MGLTAWRGSTIRKYDVSIAKNYLNEEEIKDLNEIVTMYLDYAERQARKRRTVTMAEWSDKLDVFLKQNEEDLKELEEMEKSLLKNKGAKGESY